MPEDTSRLYLYVKDWERHQPRSDRPNLPWLRLHTDLLGNDAWLELSTADRCLLIGIWMVTQRYGNGRLLADERWLKSQAKAHKSSLDRLVQAGFITLSTTKAEPYGGLEEKREETRPSKVLSPSLVVEDGAARSPQKRLTAPTNGQKPKPHKKDTEAHLAMWEHQILNDEALPEGHPLTEMMTREEMKQAIAAIRPQLGAP